MDNNNNKPSKLNYLTLAVFIYVVSIVISVITRKVLSADNRFFELCDSQISTVAAMVQSVVVAITAAFAFYQLRVGAINDKKKTDNEEARFILSYNQALIESKAAYGAEHSLERWMDGFDEKRKKNPNITPLELKESIPLEITDMNCRKYINYLVYFEGLAALIIKDVLRLETIDDLFAYNFYLAINNPILQDHEIKRYPEYFRGCLKVYDKWTKYRVSNNHPILFEEFSIDKWEHFPYYSSVDITIRNLNPQHDKLETVAELIYGTDEYIYPAIFGDKKKAQKLLPTIIKKANGLFSFKNISVAIDKSKKKIVGVVVATDKAFSIDIDDHIKNKLPKTFQDVYKEYFEELPSKYSGLVDAVYIACLFVHKDYRGRRISKMLLTQIINKYEKKDIYLDVLKNNKIAVDLYEKFGFTISSEQDGYPAQRVYTMIRKKSI